MNPRKRIQVNTYQETGNRKPHFGMNALIGQVMKLKKAQLAPEAYRLLDLMDTLLFEEVMHALFLTLHERLKYRQG